MEGYIITLKTGIGALAVGAQRAAKMTQLEDMVLSGGRSAIYSKLDKSKSWLAVAAKVDHDKLEELLAQPEIDSIEADCIIQLDPYEVPQKNDVQEGATWGIDRTDQRELPLSRTYDDSGWKGENVRVCTCAILRKECTVHTYTYQSRECACEKPCTTRARSYLSAVHL